MSLIIPTIFFLLLNFSFTQNDIKKEFDDLNSLIEANNLYYNSLEYQTKDCVGTKGYYNDTCYSTENPRSIYTFNDISPSSCGTNQFFTELDEDQNLLSNPQCVNKNFNFSDKDSSFETQEISEGSDSTYITANAFRLYQYDKDIFNYYYYSCLSGGFERSCDFVANLYALSLYSNSYNKFFTILHELNDKLREGNIL